MEGGKREEGGRDRGTEGEREGGTEGQRDRGRRDGGKPQRGSSTECSSILVSTGADSQLHPASRRPNHKPALVTTTTLTLSLYVSLSSSAFSLL